ncbi:hypothetical protein GCM10027615_54980 [Plantactinospora veratri]
MRLTKRATARMVVAGVVAVTLVVTSAPASAAPAAAGHSGEPPKTPTAHGYGGAVSTVDPTATAVGLAVLRRGGNAVDAAVAAAATLGVTEPFSAGIGGGGFFVYYDARTRRVHTIDGRESAPASIRADSFVDPASGTPYPFQQARVSGLSVGVPGTLLTWHEALRRWGSRPLSAALAPAAEVAGRGFVVDATFRQQVAENAAAFAQFDATRKLYLPGGQPRRSVPSSATGTWPKPTGRSPGAASTSSTRARSVRTSLRRCAARRSPPTRPCPGSTRSSPAG